MDPLFAPSPVASANDVMEFEQTNSANKITPESVPRSLFDIERLLASCGVASYEPAVAHALLELEHRIMRELVDEATVYKEHAGKAVFDTEDVDLALQSTLSRSFTVPPNRELLAALAAQKNAQPLPLIPNKSGLILPPDRFQLTAPHLDIDWDAIEAKEQSEQQGGEQENREMDERNE